MGRPRGGSKVSSSSDATSKVDAKSKTIRTSTRERKEILHNYNEDSHSESEEQEEREETEVVSDFEGSLSESVSEGDSSGSEYGVKKKKAKISPKKAGRGSVGRGRGRPSPKGKGKAAAKPKGRPGRKPKTPSTPVTKTRPSRSQPNKKMKYRERSDSEEESEPELSDESEPEEPIESESDVEEEVPKSDSASDGEGKSRKRKAPQPKGPKAKGSPSAKNNVKAPSAKNGSDKKKNKLSDESDGFDEDEEDGKKDKVEKKEKAAVGSDANGESSEDGVGEDNGEKKEKPAPVAVKSDTKPKPSSADSDEEDDDDVDMEEEKEVVGKGKNDEPEKTLKNQTDTDYKSLNFDCEKKTTKGDPWNFKISCWNIGGIKAWVKKNGMEFLNKEDPDVMCLQEVRSSEKTQPPEVKSIENYPHIYWSFAEASGHHGVGLLSKTKPLTVQIGFPVKDDDSDEDKKFKNMFSKEGRLIVAEYDKFFLLNAYVPNGGRGGSKDDGKPYPPRVLNGERAEWDRLFRSYIKELDAKKTVIVTGDLNVAHGEIDLANPKTNGSTAGFTKEEREGFDKLLQEADLVDTFRLLYPDEKGAYSFWSYMHNARSKNVGWRLDYHLVSSRFKDNVAENTMRSKVLGSDHCPITLMVHV